MFDLRNGAAHKSVVSLGRRRVFVFVVGGEGRFVTVTRPAKLYSTTFGCPDCEGIRAGIMGLGNRKGWSVADSGPSKLKESVGSRSRRTGLSALQGWHREFRG